MMTQIRSSTCSSPALIRAERGSPDIYVRSPDSLRPKDRDGAKRLARRPPEHPFSPMARFARWRPPCVEGGQTSDRAEGPLWAVKPNSRSLSNVSYGADSGPSRGDHSRRPFRPIATSTLATSDGRFTSIPACRGRCEPRGRSRRDNPTNGDPRAGLRQDRSGNARHASADRQRKGR
jgi:hypothetical protein